MMTFRLKFTILFLVVFYSIGYSQHNTGFSNQDNTSNTKVFSNSTILYEKGVEKNEDGIQFSEEAEKVLNDKDYRNVLYPNEYNWSSTKLLLNENQIKIAIWHLIKLSSKSDLDKERTIVVLNKLQDKISVPDALLASFHTYAYFDPEVSLIEGNSFEINRPDRLEHVLATVNYLISSINSNKH